MFLKIFIISGLSFVLYKLKIQQ